MIDQYANRVIETIVLQHTTEIIKDISEVDAQYVSVLENRLDHLFQDGV